MDNINEFNEFNELDELNVTEALKPEKKKKAKFYLPISAILAYLMVASFLATGINLSRYTSNSQANDFVNTAKFSVTTTGSNVSPGLCADGYYVKDPSLPYTLTIKNDSETAINYTLRLENVYEKVQVYFKIGSTTYGPKVPESVSGGYGTVNFYSNMSYNASHTVQITFKYTDGTFLSTYKPVTAKVFASSRD